MTVATLTLLVNVATVVVLGGVIVLMRSTVRNQRKLTDLLLANRHEIEWLRFRVGHLEGKLGITFVEPERDEGATLQ